MRTDGVEEDQLQEDISLNKICSWFFFVAIQQIEIFNRSEFVQSILNDISINHIFIGFGNSDYLLLHFIFENVIKMSKILLICYSLSVF